MIYKCYSHFECDETHPEAQEQMKTAKEQSHIDGILKVVGEYMYYVYPTTDNMKSTKMNL